MYAQPVLRIHTYLCVISNVIVYINNGRVYVDLLLDRYGVSSV
jgi:hypothetical protein